MAERKIDPGLFTIILGTYDNIAREMAVSLERSAWTPIINLCRDFSVAIIDHEFNLIAVPEEILPIQAMTAQRLIKNMAAFFAGEIYEGDVLMCNLAYLGNTHMGEPSVVSPVFYRGELMFWTVARGHLMDIGTPAPALLYPYTKDLYSEGLKIPPVKLYERGKLRKDILELYLTNLRYRTLTHGDLMAHVAATWLGKDRLSKFVDKYGPETVRLYTRELLDYTDRMVGAEIRKMKPGTYYGEDWMDTNSFGTKNIPVRAKLTVKDDMWIVDLSDNVPQMIGGINASLEGCTEAAVAIGLGMCVDPRIPKNEGLHRHYQIICPEGNLLNAQPPFSTQFATTAAPESLLRALLRAAVGACPEMVPAGSAIICGVIFSGKDHRGGRNVEWSYPHLNEMGGGGASSGGDGCPCMLEMTCAGGAKIASIEMTEWLSPLLVEQSELTTDAEGAGKWRGAPGVVTRINAYECSPLEVYKISQGNDNLSYGALGGKPGVGGVVFIYDPKNPEKRRFFSSTGGFTLPPGWVYSALTSGGGGYGDPLERDLELVGADVRDEIVSVVNAREDYGVILIPETLEIDRRATEELRDRMRRERGELPLVSPTEPGLSTLRQGMMSEKDEYVDLDRSPEL